MDKLEVAGTYTKRQGAKKKRSAGLGLNMAVLLLLGRSTVRYTMHTIHTMAMWGRARLERSRGSARGRIEVNHKLHMPRRVAVG